MGGNSSKQRSNKQKPNKSSGNNRTISAGNSGSFIYELEKPCASFCGREEELAIIDSKFKSEINEGLMMSFVQIHGPAGIGKTELAKSYGANFIAEEKGNCNCIWLDYGSHRSMLHSVRRLGAQPQINSPVAGPFDKVGIAKLFWKLTSHKKCLIILDNTNGDQRAGIGALILGGLFARPAPKHPVHILLLSNGTSTILGSSSSVALGFLKETSSTLLFRSLPPNQSELNNQICDKLCNLPAGLNIVQNYIKKHGALERLWQSLNMDKAKVQNIQSRLGSFDIVGVYLIWKFLQKEIFAKEGDIGTIAEELLFIMSYMSPYDINVSDLTHLYYHRKIGKWDKDLLEKSLQLLVDYSLIQIIDFNKSQIKILMMDMGDIVLDMEYMTSNTGKIMVQRIVQAVIRVDGELVGKDVGSIIEVYNKKEIFAGKHEVQIISSSWIEHLGWLYDYLQIYSHIYPNFKESEFGQKVERNRMMQLMCSMSMN